MFPSSSFTCDSFFVLLHVKITSSTTLQEIDTVYLLRYPCFPQRFKTSFPKWFIVTNLKWVFRSILVTCSTDLARSFFQFYSRRLLEVYSILQFVYSYPLPCSLTVMHPLLSWNRRWTRFYELLTDRLLSLWTWRNNFFGGFSFKAFGFISPHSFIPISCIGTKHQFLLYLSDARHQFLLYHSEIPQISGLPTLNSAFSPCQPSCFVRIRSLRTTLFTFVLGPQQDLATDPVLVGPISVQLTVPL